jgi:hypothetical protein
MELPPVLGIWMKCTSEVLDVPDILGSDSQFASHATPSSVFRLRCETNDEYFPPSKVPSWSNALLDFPRCALSFKTSVAIAGAPTSKVTNTREEATFIIGMVAFLDFTFSCLAIMQGILSKRIP